MKISHLNMIQTANIILIYAIHIQRSLEQISLYMIEKMNLLIKIFPYVKKIVHTMDII